MLIDSFLFFQELDLLEIRLEYLYPIVDKFIIVEARQSFKGSIKGFIFEKNIKRYKKYIDKIIYHRIEDIHYEYKELLNFLEKSDTKGSKKISSFIKDHTYYDKRNLSYLLDTYHRECIHMALLKICNADDIVMLSDLDEIPEFQIIKNLKQESKFDNLMVFIQHEFQYYLNNYANSNWHGTILGTYKSIKDNSLNILRKNSRKLLTISNSGYHFTSIGNKKTIINKIENWGHQEFNHKIIKENIEDNLVNGRDIFYRIKRHRNKLVNLDNNIILDHRMAKILKNFDNLILKDLKTNKFFNIKYFYFQILFNLIRVINNPIKFLKKMYSFLFKK